MHVLERNYSDGTFNQHEVIMALAFHKLDYKRKDTKGIGIAVVIRDYDGEYEILSIDDRNSFGSASECGDKAEYIYDTLPEYPRGTALTMGFTKYRMISDTESGDIQKLVDAYNVLQEMSQAEYTNFEEWPAMNKTEFSGWKKQQRRQRA